MKIVNALIEILTGKKQQAFRTQYAALTSRPQFSEFRNVRGDNARTMNLNHTCSTAWTKKAVWV